MFGKHVRRLRRAVLGEIGWARAHDTADGAEPKGNETAIRERSDPNRQVDVIFQQMGLPVLQS